MTTLSPLIVVAVAVLAMTGCAPAPGTATPAEPTPAEPTPAEPTPAEPTPAEPSTRPASDQLPRVMSPPVRQPRDVRAYGDRPCAVFTPAQLAGFGFDLPPDSTDTLPSGNRTCVWIDSRYTGRLSVITYPAWDILERVYRSHGAGARLFTPLHVAGLPAVAHQSAPGMPGCYLTVGLATRQGIEITFTDLREPPDDPCGAARTAAQVAVHNLPPLTPDNGR